MSWRPKQQNCEKHSSFSRCLPVWSKKSYTVTKPLTIWDIISLAKKSTILLAALLTVSLVVLAVVLLDGNSVPVLQPKGTIASQQRDLIILATLLSLLVILPVFALTGYISWKYRASNKKARYTPNWDGSKRLETLWWGIPTILILILSAMIYKSSHDLDPARALQANEKTPITVQVVALQWKWLFIYPEQGIATVNYLQIPEDTPINFVITADAPMNSFWIPQLGGQVYAMAGMATRLHLMADEPGEYRGSSANISGAGFSGMTFTTKATSERDFGDWVRSSQDLVQPLTLATYNDLARPSKNNQPRQYAPVDKNLYEAVMMKYVAPSHTMGGHH